VRPVKSYTIVIAVFVIFHTLFMGLMAIGISYVDRSRKRVHRVARAWANGILKISRIQVAADGFNRLHPNAAYVFMANHESNFDIPVLMSCLQVPARWLAKTELFRIPIFGKAMRQAGYIGIDRSDRASAIASLKTAAAILRRGDSIVIFPEGTRSRDGCLQSFKKGGFVMALEAGAPIVPVIIHGTFSIMPKNRFLIRPGCVKVEIRQPVPTSAYRRSELEQLMEHIHATMREAKAAGPARRA
jgi:1-acyl-sn-glycerol-3-phosphate acyltransferase